MTNPKLISMSESRILRSKYSVCDDWTEIEVLVKRDGRWEDKTIRLTRKELVAILQEETSHA